MLREDFAAYRHVWTIPLLFVLFIVAANVNAATLYGVNTSNQLVSFNSATSGTVTTIGPVSGLQPGEDVLGIDFRPATSQLYALGSTGRLYVINKTTGAAAFVASLSMPLSGTAFGVDFNPTVDRFRIVSNTGQNLRVNPNDGLVTSDSTLNPATTGITAAAYTNNFNGSTMTTLYDIDVNNDTLYLQGGVNGSPSPNGGVT